MTYDEPTRTDYVAGFYQVWEHEYRPGLHAKVVAIMHGDQKKAIVCAEVRADDDLPSWPKRWWGEMHGPKVGGVITPELVQRRLGCSTTEAEILAPLVADALERPLAVWREADAPHPADW